MTDDIPADLVAKLMVKCARRCCICRRFRPTKLQVHHIVPRGEGGNNDEDNLTVTCLTCHSDVHTTVPFTRRFTAQELKWHRDEVFRAVQDGRLPAQDEDDTDTAIAQLVGQMRAVVPHDLDALLPEAIEILLAAAHPSRKDGVVLTIRRGPKLYIQVDNKSLADPDDARAQARYKKALDQLLHANLLARISDAQTEVTYEGYLVADEIMTSGPQALTR
jgi:hypothetical protein